MSKFLDNAGRTWLVAVNVTAIKRARQVLDLDLYGLLDDDMAGLAGLLGDPVRLVDALYVLCQDQAKDEGVSDEDFGRAMYGDAIGSAADAFLAAFADFFPEARIRDGLRRLIAAMDRLRDRSLDQLMEKLTEIESSPELGAGGSNGSSGTSPASSGSTPDPSPSAN